MVQAFDMVDKVAARFKKTYENFYNAHRKARFYEQSTKWIPQWFMAFTLAGLYVAAPYAVESGLSAGAFAAIVKSFLKLKSGVQNIHSASLKMQRSIVALEKVAGVLNRPTLHEEKLTLANSAGGTTCAEEFRNSMVNRLAAKPENLRSTSDLDFLRFEQVSFGYPRIKHLKNMRVTAKLIKTVNTIGRLSPDRSRNLQPGVVSPSDVCYNCGALGHWRHECPKIAVKRKYSIAQGVDKGVKGAASAIGSLTNTLSRDVTDWHIHGDVESAKREVNRWQLKNVTVQIPTEGSLIYVQDDLDLEGCMVGAGSKRTLLRLMASIVHPVHGGVWMPPHKSVTLLERTPVILKSTIMENLRFGVHDDVASQLSNETCWAVALTLGLSEHLLYSEDVVNLELLTTRDALAICLARTFLAEPGVILIDHIGDSMGE